jgi:RecB family exonuclease
MLQESLLAPSLPRDDDAVCELVRSLARATRRRPLERKVLVCATRTQGRELLGALSRTGTPWIGWEVATPRDLVARVAARSLDDGALVPIDELEALARADAALNETVAWGEAGPLRPVAELEGYRDAVRSTIGTLRDAGLRPADLERKGCATPKLRALASVLRRYEARLEADRRVDAAGLARLACDVTAASEEAPLPGRIFLLPGLPARGRSGEFLRLLLERPGAEVLTTDPVPGLVPPQALIWAEQGTASDALSRLHDRGPGIGAALELFVAASPAYEVREVLRRVVAAGIPFDEVEIVSVEPLLHSECLAGIADRLGLQATYTRGLDVRRTRVGRAVDAYLGWLESGFPADAVRRLLETGDLALSRDSLPGRALARRLRALAIGWGRDGYLPAIQRSLAGVGAEEGRKEGEEAVEFRQRVERERAELHALRDLLEPIVTATPALPARGSGSDSRIPPAALARGLLAFLERVPAPGASEREVREEIRRRLARIVETLTEPASWRSSLALVRRVLEMRVAAADGDTIAPRSSAGGRLLLSDVETGGLAGRPYTFVVGLEASAVHRAGADPLLPDPDRSRIMASGERALWRALPTSGERREERRFALAALLARLRGRVTLSYAAWDGPDGRVGAPAAELLQALRLREGSTSLTYEDLRHTLGAVRGALPVSGEIDASDIWIRTLAPDGAATEARSIVRGAFAGLDSGLRAAERVGSAGPTEYDGVVRLEGDAVQTALSPSRLETLGACPRRYFLRYVLGIRPVEDPEWDATRWLDPLVRGSMLHRVFEDALRAARAGGIRVEEPAFRDLAQRLLRWECARLARSIPSPSPSVREREIDSLARDVDSFVRLVREDPPDWIELELVFGGEDRPFVLTTRRGPFRFRGIIDRVDRLPDGTLRVVDYKTGSTYGYRQRNPFAEGRRIQHLVYLAAAEDRLGGTASRMEYHFPSVRGQNTVVRYDADRLSRGESLLEHLVTLASDGPFVATDELGDCRYCDYRDVCRVEEGEFGDTGCTAVERSKAWKDSSPLVGSFSAIRAVE